MTEKTNNASGAEFKILGMSPITAVIVGSVILIGVAVGIAVALTRK